METEDYDINDIDFEIDKFKDEMTRLIYLLNFGTYKNPNLFLSECKRVQKRIPTYIFPTNWKYSKDIFQRSLEDILT